LADDLSLAVYAAARVAGSSLVYWQTKAENASGRALYDKVAEHQGFIVYIHGLSGILCVEPID